MIKSSYLFCAQNLIADYHNQNCGTSFKTPLQKFKQFSLQVDVFNQLQEIVCIDKNKIFYFCFFYLDQKFCLFFEICQNFKKSTFQNLQDISIEIKNYTLINYEQEMIKGKVNQSFTSLLRTQLNQYESQTAKETKISLIQQNLAKLKDQAEQSFQKIIGRGNDLEDLGQEINIMTESSVNLHQSSYQLKRKIKMEKLKVQVIKGMIFLGVVGFLYFLFFEQLRLQNIKISFDFEGNSLLRLPKTATESLKKMALKAEKLCLQNCKQPLSTFNQPLKRKAQNFLTFGKKNQNSILVGFLTSGDYKLKDRAWQYIDKCFDLIKDINSDDFLVFETYQEEFLYIIKKASVNKAMSNTESLIKNQINTIENKILPNARQDLIDIQGINIKTEKVKKKAKKLEENSIQVEQEAKEYKKGVLHLLWELYI